MGCILLRLRYLDKSEKKNNTYYKDCVLSTWKNEYQYDIAQTECIDNVSIEYILLLWITIIYKIQKQEIFVYFHLARVLHTALV